MAYLNKLSTLLITLLCFPSFLEANGATTITIRNLTGDSEHRENIKIRNESVTTQRGAEPEIMEGRIDYPGLPNDNFITVRDIQRGYRITVRTVGFVCNTLSFLIITRQGLVKMGVWVYIAALALCDNFFIIIDSLNMLNEFSNDLYLDNFKANSEVFCKLHFIVLYVPLVTGNYLLAIMTCERAGLILNPYKIPSSPRRALLVVSIVTLAVILVYSIFVNLVIGVIHVQVPLFTGANDSSLTANESISLTFKYCQMYENNVNLYLYIITTIYLLIPATLIIIANICIIAVLIRRARNSSIHRNNSKMNDDKRITRMLIFISIYFILTVSPNVLYTVFLWPYFYENVQDAFAYDNITWNLLHSLYITNVSSNFFIYVASGQIFRKAAKDFFDKLFKNCKSSNHAQQSVLESTGVPVTESPRI